MKIQVWQSGRFNRDAWDSQIGKVIPFKIAGQQIGETRLIAAEVVADGVTLTLDVPDEIRSAFHGNIADFSVAVGDPPRP